MPDISVSINPTFAQLGSMFQGVQLGTALQKAITIIAYQIERQAKQVTPVDTGRLRSSIMTDIGNLRATVAPHTNYALFVHEGTRRMKGRPFMKWGVDASLNTLEKIVLSEVNAELESKIK